MSESITKSSTQNGNPIWPWHKGGPYSGESCFIFFMMFKLSSQARCGRLGREKIEDILTASNLSYREQVTLSRHPYHTTEFANPSRFDFLKKKKKVLR